MEYKQGEMNFRVHEVENNTEMQYHLEENRKHFSAQCKKVFNLLMSGKELTVLSAITEHGISSLPRRLMDCSLNGVKYSERWFKPESGAKYKVWFMNEDDKKKNQHLLSEQNISHL